MSEFEHIALFYSDDVEYLAGTLPFIRAGLTACEPVVVAVPPQRLVLLRIALGEDADLVACCDITAAGRNPGRIIPALLHSFADAHPGARVRVVGEPVWAGRSSEEYPACAQHEALINTALADRRIAILCPYDVSTLDPDWIRDAYRTHPVLATADLRWPSTEYEDPVVVANGFNEPLPDPPAEAATIAVDLQSLAQVRRFVADRAAAWLPADRVPEVTLAVNELAANAVEHGGGSGMLAIWAQAEHLVCQVSDAGCGAFLDPLAGRRPRPAHAAVGGRGLLLVHQLCDLVRTHTGAAGTTTRVHILR